MRELAARRLKIGDKVRASFGWQGTVKSRTRYGATILWAAGTPLGEPYEAFIEFEDFAGIYPEAMFSRGDRERRSGVINSNWRAVKVC